MGRRKERRLAAKAAASGRRVKLDLFGDPSGMEASLQEEVGEDVRNTQKSDVPTSPSASGIDEENPLSLLGQYTDEDSEEEHINQPNGAIKEKSPLSSHVEDVDAHDVKANNNKGPACDHTEHEADQADDVMQPNNDSSVVGAQHSESETKDQSLPDSSGMQIVGDAGGPWKIVMHSESNQCYYWNTITGETSWEVPSGLASGATSDITTSYQPEAAAHLLPHSTISVYASSSGVDAYANLGIDCGTGQIVEGHYAYAATAASFSGTDLSLQVGVNSLQVPTDEPTDVHSNRLLTYALELLQRYEALERKCTVSDELKWKKKEIELRIADCKALSSYGDTLLPFWWHVVMQFKEIETLVHKLECCTHGEAKDSTKDFSKDETCSRDVHPVTESEEKPIGADKSTYPGSKDIEMDSDSAIPSTDGISCVGISSGMTSKCLEAESSVNNERTKVLSIIDDDMDVEMEVDEDTTIADEPAISVQKIDSPPVQQVEPSCMSTCEVLAPAVDIDIPPPPPPVDEWILPPPPPPEDDYIPPPPPPPLSQADEVKLPYEQYAVTASYPHQNEVYASYAGPTATEVAEVSCFGVDNGSQLVEPQPYYVPAAVSDNFAPAYNAPAETLPYYTFPVADSSASITSFASHYGSASSNDISASASFNSSLVCEKRSQPDMSREASAPSTSKTEESTTVMGTSAVSTSGKNQTKATAGAVRGKKRSVAFSSALMSSKKVSTLLDKWKAAKEELREQEEEPESALEALERKRQKEIEQWRAQQIASGEAQDNANFVPLGGDWRERVKRRRAAARKEPADPSLPRATEEHVNSQPNLEKLSKDLPTGWQAYWDESSRQVYYGNNNTAETSWTRPTK